MESLFPTTSPTTHSLSRYLLLGYGALCYLVFFASFLYAVGFIGGFAVPVTLDAAPQTDWLTAALIDVGLLALFALQHSIMARPAFKRWWTRFIPKSAERSTYVLFSSLALGAIFAWWEPLGGEIWRIDGDLGRGLLYAGFAAGWAVVLWSTFLINHFDLFGLRQVWLAFTQQPYSELKFVTPWVYQVIRHPLYLGWLLVIWCTPDMTVAHLLFAALVTGYIFMGIYLEERDLCDAHPDYADYRRRVPMILPSLRKARS
ncbi:MAG: methanethiol S-methyltransferase [Pseudomonadales bacterium]